MMRRKTAQALALRARIVLARTAGGPNKDVEAKLSLGRSAIGKWRRRFVERRVDGLHNVPCSGAPSTIEHARVDAVIVKTLETLPDGATHWSSRDMAKASALSVVHGATRLAGLGEQPPSHGDVQRAIQISWPRCAMSWALMSRRRRTPSFSEWREVANPRAEPQPADVADAPWPRGPEEP